MSSDIVAAYYAAKGKPDEFAKARQAALAAGYVEVDGCLSATGAVKDTPAPTSKAEWQKKTAPIDKPSLKKGAE